MALRRRVSVAVSLVTVLAALATPAVAQVRYAPRVAPADPFLSPLDPALSPYDESYDTHPSFQIFPNAYGAPAVRVIQRCAYPNGWNVTDFSRDLNGIPPGIDHTCPASETVRARY